MQRREDPVLGPAIPTNTTKRRRCRKGRAAEHSTEEEQGGFSLPMEVLSLVCTYFQRTPRTIFLLMKACKGLRAHLTADWWQQFWDIHKATVLDRKLRVRHHYLNEVVHGPNLRPSQLAHILRLVYGLRCERCGARWNHRVVTHLHLRLCEPCLRDNVVSNRVLYYRYGLSVAEVLDEHSHLITYFPVTTYHRRDLVFRALSVDPIDLAGFGSDGSRRQELAFLWLPDVARLYDLPSLFEHQQARLAGINRIKACMRRHRLRVAIDEARRTKRCSLAHVASCTIAHEFPVQVPPLNYLVGGPGSAWCVLQPYNVARVIACDRATRSSRIFGKLHVSTPRPLLGFDEVCSKTWLEKFGAAGVARPPPDSERPFHLNGVWRFPLNVYSVRTGELMFTGCTQQGAEGRESPPRFVRFPPLLPPPLPPPPPPSAPAAAHADGGA